MGMGMAGKRHADRISHRSLLFLFDISTKEMTGVYGATAAVQIDWVRDAFGGRFPVQVRGFAEEGLVGLTANCAVKASLTAAPESFEAYSTYVLYRNRCPFRLYAAAVPFTSPTVNDFSQ